MKNWLTFFTFFLSTAFLSTAQLTSIPEDSLVNRMNLNTLNQSIESGKGTAENYFNRGNLHFFFKDTAQALADFSEAISLDKDFDMAYLSRGTVYQKQHQYQLAEADFNSAIKLGKFPSIALNNRGFLYQNWDKVDRAIKDYERAIKLDPTHTQPYMNLVDVYMSRGEEPAAFTKLDEMVAARPKDPKAYTTRSEVYKNAGRFREAMDDLNKAVEISQNDPEFLIERAKFKDDCIYDDLGAIEDCDLAIQQEPNIAEYYYQRSRPMYDLADYVGVLENCEKAIELNPKHVHALIMKANVTDMYEMHDEARELYERAISIAPNEYDGYKQLSISEFAQGKKKKALSTLETYMNRGNFHKDITEQHGKIAADLKQFDVSLKDFSELIERYPDNPTYYFFRGVTQDSIGNYEAACDDMVKSDQLGCKSAKKRKGNNI